jgi:hypothetical protein
MEWHVVDERESRTEWERSDRFARAVLRQTATGTWAATLDVLEQAPEGPHYERETFPNREDALAQLNAWRERHASE